MFIKKGDNVIVLAGREKGKSGKIIQVLSKAGSVVIEGLNLRKRHARARRAGEKGQILTLPAPIASSNVMLLCSKCGKKTRAAKKILPEGKITRACKNCKEIIE
ncbi:50S ribosomal protein L24 [Candidatus Uhrbacteria bacterium]|nr:50S ribosomal protein L24 [Candidatus Uhrbacteria bacterium]